jgi:uncharacterized damage-inducible protein DinB
MTRLDIALDLIRQTREYTHRMLETISPSDWFWQPKEGVTHVAWQVGHLAIAQYFLCLVRVRGQRPEDEQLIAQSFSKLFERQSAPNADAAKYPAPAVIREVFDRVHQQVLDELPALTDSDLDEPTLRPHPLFNTKLGALLWCPRHEMSHVGQIGLLRRLMGQAPMW